MSPPGRQLNSASASPPHALQRLPHIPRRQLRARNRLARWGVWLGKAGRRSTFLSLLVIPVVFTYVDDGMALVGRVLRRKGRGVQAA